MLLFLKLTQHNKRDFQNQNDLEIQFINFKDIPINYTRHSDSLCVLRVKTTCVDILTSPDNHSPFPQSSEFG